MLILLTMCIPMTSCSDGDDNKENSLLVGKWYSSNYVDGLTLTLKADNTFIEEWHRTSTGKYFYDASTKTFSLVYDSGSTRLYLVTELNDTDLVLIHLDDGDLEYFKRIQ